MLGDGYISQHIMHSYREQLEQRSYKVYMSNRAKEIASAMYGTQLETSWSDILHELDASVTREKPQTESESEIKTRILNKLNGREDENG